MCATLVLLGLLASTLAIPYPDATEKVVGGVVARKSCAVQCLPYVLAAIYYATCVAECEGKKAEGPDKIPQLEDFPSPADVLRDAGVYKECHQKCFSAFGSGDEFASCMVSCSLGAEKLENNVASAKNKVVCLNDGYGQGHGVRYDNCVQLCSAGKLPLVVAENDSDSSSSSEEDD